MENLQLAFGEEFGGVIRNGFVALFAGEGLVLGQLAALGVDFAIAIDQFGELKIPIVFSEDRRDVAFEFRQLGGRSHGFAEFAVDTGVAFLVRAILGNRSARAHYADDERQLR